MFGCLVCACVSVFDEMNEAKFSMYAHVKMLIPHKAENEERRGRGKGEQRERKKLARI